MQTCKWRLILATWPRILLAVLHTDSSAKADGLVPRRRCDSGVIAETGEADKGEAFQVLDCTLSLVLGGIDVEVDLAPTYMIAYKH